MKVFFDKLHASVGDLFKRRACPPADDLLSCDHVRNVREFADGRQGTDECCGLHPFASARERTLSDFSRIRVLAEAFAAQPGGDSDCSTRDTLHILTEAAQRNGLFIEQDEVESGEIAFLLMQGEIQSETFPEDTHISSHLQSLGLTPEDRYFFGNAVLSVTDVSARGDNVLLNDQGNLCFIDPLIRLKRPAVDVIDWLVGDFPS